MKKAVYQNTLSDTLPKGTGKGLVITAIAAVLALVVYKVLPYEANANKGLALLTFIAVLWLSEAIHITITALMIPVLAGVGYEAHELDPDALSATKADGPAR